MEESLIDRVKRVVQLKERSIRAFANKINFPYNTLNQYILGKRNTIDSNLIIQIALSFNDISERWLLTGQGEMLKNTIPESKDITLPEVPNIGHKNIDEAQKIDVLNKLLNAQKESYDLIVEGYKQQMEWMRKYQDERSESIFKELRMLTSLIKSLNDKIDNSYSNIDKRVS